jgi:hypothetical protein
MSSYLTRDGSELDLIISACAFNTGAIILLIGQRLICITWNIVNTFSPTTESVKARDILQAGVVTDQSLSGLDCKRRWSGERHRGLASENGKVSASSKRGVYAPSCDGCPYHTRRVLTIDVDSTQVNYVADEASQRTEPVGISIWRTT